MGAYEEALDGLNKAQLEAVRTTDGPVLVIAGPGTGKTQLLTTRIAHILATTDALPQNILCLTFTESGATTMRERLAGMIGQAAYDVTISTYHAFGSELIRRFPDYFTDDLNLQPIDDLGLDSIFREIIAALPYSNPLKYSDAYLGDIKTLVSDAKRALLSPDDLRATAKANLTYIAQASPLVSATLGNILRLSKKDVANFEALADKLRALPPVQAGSPVASFSELLLADLDRALDDVNALGKQTPLTQWKNTWLAKDSDSKFVIDGQKTNEKLLATADIYEQYLTELQARSLFDYDDMILRAVHALEANNDLRYTLQEQYLYLLLDEFQDTNGAQLRIVELLTDNPVNEGRPNVLAVGDDDQAIYAFQGADYSHMLRFKDMYQDVKVIPLTQNYRSHADILHTARGIAEQIEARLHHHFPAIEKTLTAENTRLPKQAIVERREAGSDVMQFAWVTRRIRELLDSGIPASEIAVLAPQHKYLEPLVPFLAQAEIPVRYDKRENILDVPAINQLLRMAELCLALAAKNQPLSNALWAEVLSFDFWQLPTSLIWRLSWQATDDNRSWTEELLEDERLKPIALFFIRLSIIAGDQTLETMLDYLIGSTPLELAEPGYEDYSSPFYTYHFGGLSTDGGWQVMGQRPPRAQRSEHGDETNDLIGPRQAVSRPATPGPEQNAEFWDLLTSLVVLRARLCDYRRGAGADEPLYLQDFLNFIEAHRAAGLKILNTSPYSSGREAVHLMTAFKAKGMEFTAVFVLAGIDEAWGSKARGAGNRIALPANLQFIRYASTTNDEHLRLLYVAMTRAKSHLYLLSYTQTYTGKGTTRLKYLDEFLDENQLWHSPLLPEDRRLVQPAEDHTAAPTTELAAYWQQRHERALTNADMHGLLQDRLARLQLSPTHINDFTDVIYCGPQTFFLRTILRFPVAPRPEVQFGNAMHETLEWIHKIAKQNGLLPSKQVVHKAFEQRLRAKRLTPRDTELYLQRGRNSLEVYLRKRGATISPDNVVEYNFRGEGVFIGKAHLTGKIDKLIIDKAARTITIVDYKTGIKSHTKWTREAKLHKYRLQLYMYRTLVEGSHTYSGYTVTGAYVEFIEPDDNGDIRELHLPFDEAEYQRVRRLTEIVWQRIVTLDLPDISAYTPDLAGIEAFEADLLDEKEKITTGRSVTGS